MIRGILLIVILSLAAAWFSQSSLADPPNHHVDPRPTVFVAQRRVRALMWQGCKDVQKINAATKQFNGRCKFWGADLGTFYWEPGLHPGQGRWKGQGFLGWQTTPSTTYGPCFKQIVKRGFWKPPLRTKVNIQAFRTVYVYMGVDGTVVTKPLPYGPCEPSKKA